MVVLHSSFHTPSSPNTRNETGRWCDHDFGDPRRCYSLRNPSLLSRPFPSLLSATPGRSCARGASRPTTPSPWACTAGCPWPQLSTETGRRPSRTPSVRWAACGESPQRSKEEEEDDCWPGRSIEALAAATVVMEFVADVGVVTTVEAVASASAEGAAVTSGTVTVSRLWCLRNALSLLRR